VRVIPRSRRDRVVLGGAVIALVVAAGAAYTAFGRSDDDSFDCTLAGCRSAVGVELTQVPKRAVMARLCTQDRCDTARRDGAQGDLALVVVPVRGSERRRGRIVRLDMRLFDRRGRALKRGRGTLRLTRRAPNGLRCGPICFGAAAVFNAKTGRVKPF
jgi:hypothetical protein